MAKIESKMGHLLETLLSRIKTIRACNKEKMSCVLDLKQKIVLYFIYNLTIYFLVYYILI